jgi:catechol-2,3-dioxygenase
MSIWANIVELNPPIDSAVDFPTSTRFHIALNVKDVDALLPFYRVLFGNHPTVVRDGYAKFELVEPPLNISLNRVTHNARGHGQFGMQLSSADRLASFVQRLRAAGQDIKSAPAAGEAAAFVIEDPEANRWKLFV